MSAEPLPDSSPAPQAWLERWQHDGDAEALDALLRFEIEALSRRLRVRARGMLGASVSASDLAQEAALRMLRLDEPPEFSSERELRAYLWQTAWNLLVNRLERRRRADGPEPVDDASRLDVAELQTAGGFSTLERKEQALALGVVLRLLEPGDREVLEAVYFRHEPIEALAARLGVARSALDMRLSRARARLGEKMLAWSKAIG